MPFDLEITELTMPDLTEAKVDGSGAFDVLMKAMASHLDDQFKLGRLKGTDYSQVYLGGLQATMSTALEFLLRRRREVLEAEGLRIQNQIAEQQLLKIQADVRLTNQQILNLEAEALNIPKQGALLDQQLLKEVANTALIQQNKLNAEIEHTVLVAQECKLRAEYDLTLKTVEKSEQEIQLLLQKTATERAQTQDIGVDENSMVGRQKFLLKKQADGFDRDAEQRVADTFVKTWATRRTTDSATVADATNMLYDTAIGRAMNKLLAGINA